MSRRAALVWWLAWSAGGLTLLVLPDYGPRVITFSGAHGPGLVDVLGIALLLVGTGGLWRYLWAARRSLVPVHPLLVFLAGLGTGLIVASVFIDLPVWWAIGAGILLAVQIVFVVRAHPP